MKSHSGPRSLASGTLGPGAPLRRFGTMSMAASRCDPQHHDSRTRTVDAGENIALPIAVIDGPYDTAALSGVLARMPTRLADGHCGVNPSSACNHGTFIIGLLGARQDALIPGMCPDCQLLHIPIFQDGRAPHAGVAELANAIALAVGAGARLVNLSVAVLGNDSEHSRELARSLDCAADSDAVVVVAAGNQGRLVTGQLFLHPATVPVVAVDAAGNLLPDSNFGPSISRRGVAVPGQRVRGYAPGGGTAEMSGTSVATAIATGVFAQVWSRFPNVDGASIRAAVARLSPRDGPAPPMLNRDALLMTLDQKPAIAAAASFSAGRRNTNYASLQGETTMSVGNGLPRFSSRSVDPSAMPGQTAIPASGGCTCGASGACTCDGNVRGESGFVYAIGTVEAECPNIAIEHEMMAWADALGIDVAPDPNMPTKLIENRAWQYAVLNQKETRYIARQLVWRLTVEDFPVFVLRPQDPSDLDALIDCLKYDKYSSPGAARGEKQARSKKETRGKKDRKAAPANNGTETVVSIGAPDEQPRDLDVIVGARGASTPDGIEVLLDHVFRVPEAQLSPGGLQIFGQLSDNFGLSDADRAYNFLTARYKIPPRSFNEIETLGLVGVPVVSSRLSGENGRVVRVIFTLKGANIPIEKRYFVRVDVTHKFPTILNPWQSYIERGEAS
jgi:Subtilase family/PatG C-terminal/PatG Domain